MKAPKKKKKKKEAENGPKDGDEEGSKRSVPNFVKLVPHEDWLERHKEVVALLPEAARPPSVPHGEHSYTVMCTCGTKRKIAKFHILIRDRAYRVKMPKMKKEEGPQVRWGDDAAEAWALVTKRAGEKLDSED